jgi:hypothetical protein
MREKAVKKNKEAFEFIPDKYRPKKVIASATKKMDFHWMIWTIREKQSISALWR